MATTRAAPTLRWGILRGKPTAVVHFIMWFPSFLFSNYKCLGVAYGVDMTSAQKNAYGACEIKFERCNVGGQQKICGCTAGYKRVQVSESPGPGAGYGGKNAGYLCVKE
jgi:hypothetical protein